MIPQCDGFLAPNTAGSDHLCAESWQVNWQVDFYCVEVRKSAYRPGNKRELQTANWRIGKVSVPMIASDRMQRHWL